jgi:hydrogenase 3 maturation protease
MNIREQLLDALRGNVVVVGVGNLCRGDDAAGSRVSQQIRSAPGVHVIDAQEVPENHLRQVAELRPDTVVFIDCVDLRCLPGSVALFDAEHTLSYWPSTHRVPLSLIFDYLKQTTRAQMFVIAIQPQQIGLLEPMSADVSSAVESIADVLNDVLEMRNSSLATEGACPTASEVTV